MTERVPWKESNLALIGSDLDHKIKAAAADSEPQWEGIGDSTGLWVWRIEQFKVVPWPKQNYGAFHEGDSYVVLNSYTEGSSDKINHDIHIWIGNESSQDEYGTAAYKMVECDDKLGGAAVQHREVEGHESIMFQSYFDNQLTYLQGGVESGFRKVEATVDVPFLYRIKGTFKGTTMTQMPLKKSSLNQGDSFILFGSNAKVWCWHGASANAAEQHKANVTAEKMCTRGTVVTLKPGCHDDDDTFWGYLENDGEIGEALDGDEIIEKFTPVLLQIKEGGDPIKVAEGESVSIGHGSTCHKLARSELKPDAIFLLDAGWDLFVWIGEQAALGSKVNALGCAGSYSKQEPRAALLPMTMVKAGYEPSDFSGYFYD